MAKVDVIMPQMGESIAEGTLSRWIKKVGDTVQRDEPIFEISTDKVDAEIPAPNAGVLAEILVQEGQTVSVQTVVARIKPMPLPAQRQNPPHPRARDRHHPRTHLHPRSPRLPPGLLPLRLLLHHLLLPRVATAALSHPRRHPGKFPQ